jgi:hypothetical protein
MALKVIGFLQKPGSGRMLLALDGKPVMERVSLLQKVEKFGP